MNRKTMLLLRAGLALAALLGFVYLYGRAMIESVSAGSSPVYSEGYIYVATILAGLVGGVAALGLGQSGVNGIRRQAVWRALGRTLAPFQTENVQNTLAIVYTVVYIVAGIAALLVWITAPAEQPVHEMIRNLALIFLGLAIATAQAFFGLQPDASMPRAVTKATRKHHK